MKVEEEVEVQSHPLLTSTLNRRKWSVPRPTALLHSKEPDILTEQNTGWAFRQLMQWVTESFTTVKKVAGT